MDAVKAGIGAAGEGLRSAVVEYLKSGSFGAEGAGPRDVTNPTFLLAPDLQYTVYYSSSIFRAVALGPGGSAWERLTATVAPQLRALADALRAGRCRCVLVPGDVLTVMTTQAAESADEGHPPSDAAVQKAQFDFIDCSNVADYVSMQAILQAAAPLLRRQPHARLRFESLVQFQRDPRQDVTAFVRTQVGPTLAPLESLTGLQLAGSRAVATGVRLEFCQKLPTADEAPLTAGFLLLQLQPVCRELLAPKPRPDGGGPAEAAAPVALAHLLALAAPRQASALLRLLMKLDCGADDPPCAWELLLHTSIQSDPALEPRCLTYRPEPGLSLLPYPQAPLALVLSPDRLPRGAGPSGTSSHQVLTAFHWDEAKATVQFLLDPTVLREHSAWFVTLSVQLPGGELVA
eukprot:EG_transcript_14692